MQAGITTESFAAVLGCSLEDLGFFFFIWNNSQGSLKFITLSVAGDLACVFSP